MTEKRLRELFTLWQSRLGLDNWRITVEIGPGDTDTSAMENHRSTTYSQSHIMVQPWVLKGDIPENVIWNSFPEPIVEALVVHELLHCSTQLLNAMIYEELEGQLHRDAYSIFYKGFNRIEEGVIEDLAQALVRNWPK